MPYNPDTLVPVFVKVGRPSKYKEEYCQTVIDVMSQGKSKTAFCHSIGITTATMYHWRDDHPEFLSALKQAEESCRVWWEQLCLDEACGVEGAQFKTGSVMFARNVLGWKTRDVDNPDPEGATPALTIVMPDGTKIVEI